MTFGGRRRPLHRRRTARLAVLLVLAQLALIPVFSASATAVTLCNFPGHDTWTREDGTAIQSATWFEEVQVIDVHTSPPTITTVAEDLDAPLTIRTATGNIIRAEGYVCNSWPGSASGYAFSYRFRDAGPQPNWDSRDKVEFTEQNINQAVEVGHYWQQVGPDAGYEITPLFFYQEGIKATGPTLKVTATTGTIPQTDKRGPPNGGQCGSLGPGKYSAQIAQDGNVERGVWDNDKRSLIERLSYNSLRNRIHIDLVTGRSTPSKFKVGDRVTIEDAQPESYNGTWRIQEIGKSKWIETSGPDRLSMDRGGGGTVTRYYSSGEELSQGMSLAGYVEICVGTTGVYYATEKLEPTPKNPPMKTVRWQSESLVPGILAANTRTKMRWYQKMPCKEKGDLRMWPRVVQTPGVTPDQNVLAEGAPFVFHVALNPKGTDCDSGGGGGRGLPGPLGHRSPEP
jgi:hypothetical protein